MKVKRKIIEIDEALCDGCGQCIISCAEGALELVDGKAKVISDSLCDGLGACLGECPTNALKIVEREAEEFDEEAVEEHLQKKKDVQVLPVAGCPSSNLAAFQPEGSALGHWPVQIRLVPPDAFFLKNAHLLVAADCVPVAFQGFHERFLKGKAVMIGCPKFDDVSLYIDKFAEIFNRADLKSITAVIMEVPCCSGLPLILKKAMERSGVNIPMETIEIDTRGNVIG